MFKRILVPLDGSGRAERAIPIAARLARASGGTITLVRVINTAPASLPSAQAKPLLIQTVGEVDRVQAESYLEGLAGSALLRDLPVQIQIPATHIAPGILSVAAAKHADIIVMCSHGYTGVTRWWLMGSVAEKVARFAGVPVLILREGGPVPEERRPGGQPLGVLVPLDGSAYAKAALAPAADLAVALAHPGPAALHLVHVVQSSQRAKESVRAEQNTQSQLNMAREYLAATARNMRNGSENMSLEDPDIRITSSVSVDDDVAQGIIRLAENGGDGEGAEIFGCCDIIAMTTHGYSGLQHWVGSIAERVLHTSRLPLLVVRPKE